MFRPRIVLAPLEPVVLLLTLAASAYAQEPQPPVGQDHSGHVQAQSAPVSPDRPAQPSPWMRMYDGVVFGTFNHQGGPRGGRELLSTNWVMAMAGRPAGAGQLQLTGMLSLDPWTASGRGYRLLFQAGEYYKGEPIVDRQHPHDFLMQAAIAWRVPLSSATALTLSAAPVGEPALGPIAFMHRPSAAEQVSAPLAHHTLDSSHIAMGVMTAGLELGRWMFESSLFHGGEPDDNRWDLMDPGALDSWSARAWYSPSPTWQLQVSHAYLTAPEPLEPGDARRTTASIDWWRPRPDGFFAATVAYGRNDKADGRNQALLAEATSIRGRLSAFARVETLQLETSVFLEHSEPSHVLAGQIADSSRRDVVSALTLGAVWNVAKWRGVEGGIGADATFYAVAALLEPSYGSRPVSFHVYVRVRPPVPAMGRMWNMRMGRVQTSHQHRH